MLKLSGLTLGGFALGAAAGPAEGKSPEDADEFYPTRTRTDRYSYFKSLPKFIPGTPMEPDEMRITFLGTVIPPVRRAQQEMSIFVEVGSDGTGKAKDQFVFDCGAGVCSNYGAMGIGYGRMDKVFINHLHGDHMSDLSHVYCFGPSADRKSPLYVFGASNTGFVYTDPAGRSYGPYEDGTRAYCEMLRAAMRWHSESFSFQGTSYASYRKPANWGVAIPDPVGGDAFNDAYALVPIELNWRQVGGTAYDNPDTGVKVTHFPVIHCRRGSMGYKLEWNGLSMIYTSDTKPETNCVEQALNRDANGVPRGVDVLIHEMVVPPEIWAMKTYGLLEPLPYGNPDTAWWDQAVNGLAMVQNSSHTPQGAFGYLLSQIHPRPRLTVATHFPVADDTVKCAMESVKAHVPDIGKIGEQLTWSFDLMVLRVTPRGIGQYRAVVNDYGWSPPVTDIPEDMNAPKYWMWEVDEHGQYVLDEHGERIPVGDPYAQIDRTTEILPGDDTFRKDGY